MGLLAILLLGGISMGFLFWYVGSPNVSRPGSVFFRLESRFKRETEQQLYNYVIKIIVGMTGLVALGVLLLLA